MRARKKGEPNCPHSVRFVWQENGIPRVDGLKSFNMLQEKIERPLIRSVRIPLLDPDQHYHPDGASVDTEED